MAPESPYESPKGLPSPHSPEPGLAATPPFMAGLKSDVWLRLSAMMFLQYFVWGAWFVTLGTYLGALKFKDSQVGLAYGSNALAAIIAPLFVGIVADRLFSTQRILAALHLIGGGLLFWMATIGEFTLFYPVILAYFLCYMPTLALTNSISFHQMRSPQDQFPWIRVWGTIGWIAAGMLVGFLKVESTAIPLQIAGGSSLVLGLLCLALPHTPPPNKGGAFHVGAILGLDALKLLKSIPFLVFVVASFLICIPLQFYYNWTNRFLNEIDAWNPAALMTLGQWMEIFFLLLMPLFFRRLGVKWMLAVGMLCWASRYLLFAYGAPSGPGLGLLVLGVALHGICYDFFFVTGQIYVDNAAPKTIRAQAQGFIALVTLGIGGFLGSLIAGEIVGRHAVGDSHEWLKIWHYPAIAAGVVLVLFVLLFNDRKADQSAGQ